MPRQKNGMDLSPLLPLGVLAVVIVMVFVPLAFQVVPKVVETAHQTYAYVWVIPVALVAALMLTSSGSFGAPSAQGRYQQPHTQYGGEGPSWGLLGLMLLMLLLLPWHY